MKTTALKVWRQPGGVSFYLLLTVSLGLPLILLVDSVLATRELDEMRSIFLRDRAATIAARLETMAPEAVARGEFEDLLDSEPGLLSVRVFRTGDEQAAKGALAVVRSGRSLYSAEEIRDNGKTVFRAYVPFHSSGEVNVAQIDISTSAPDFILVHARHNIITAIISGVALLLLSLYGLWATRRAARLEAQRVEMEGLAQLGRLSAVLAHEIRNPLGAIKGFAQLAREDTEGHGLKALDAIVRESKRLERLVNALLLYGKPLKPVVRVLEWEHLASELAIHAQETIGSRPIQFVSQSQIRTLSTDPDLLKQVLLNLIRNSVEAIPESGPGEIRLNASASRDGVAVIAIEDNGAGIPESIRTKLFAPFLTTKASGTGLGLAISKRVIDSLGGRLRFDSIAPRGTRAEVTLYGTHSCD